ncbi:hypothetical protein Bca52824_094530 [Brassica carinata]|uniref:Uncharacterized protein n=1 Tax=Brassica carinata TaxID=52824 RepID=A0A8X7TKP1_BRACI|nr:hypothetical protein Bca52824_094530 [Brassica carinata]
MLDLINVNYQFRLLILLGSYRRNPKPATIPQSNDAGYIADLVIEAIEAADQNLDNRSKFSSRVELIETKVVGIVKCELSNFKGEIGRSVEAMVPVCTSPRLFAEAGNKTPSIEGVAKPGFPSSDPATDYRHTDNIIPLEDANTVPSHFIETPSFSLGLTQEEQILSAEPLTRQEVANVTTLSDINVGDNIAYPQSLRKSKRQKTVPPALVQDYLCDPRIDSRLRSPWESVFVCYERTEIERKIKVLSEKLSGNVVVNVDGLVVSSREMLLMAERSQLYTGKAVDILIRLVRCVVSLPTSTGRSYYFLDTKFGTSIVRNYQKFLKAKKKECFKFPKGVVDFFGDIDASPRLGIRYYFPLKLGKSIGLEYALTHLGNGRQPAMPYKFDRPKSVFQSDNPADAGLIAVLLMVKHAVYGFEACRHLSPETVAEEGKSAAIMALESKEKL